MKERRGYEQSAKLASMSAPPHNALGTGILAIAILNQTIERHHGLDFRIVGDTFSAELEAQRTFQEE